MEIEARDTNDSVPSHHTGPPAWTARQPICGHAPKVYNQSESHTPTHVRMIFSCDVVNVSDL